MGKMPTSTIDIETLREGCSGIIPSFGSYMADCAIYCLSSVGHKPGIKLRLLVDDEHLEIPLHWKTIVSTQMHRSLNDEERTTDHGAMCVAITLVMRLTKYQHFTVSRKSSGVDFWLYEDEPKFPDGGKPDARLEVSGIRKETRSNRLVNRLKAKHKQVRQSSQAGSLAYIVLTEFGKPQSLIVSA